MFGEYLIYLNNKPIVMAHYNTGFVKMLVWKKETHKEVLFETSIDRTKVTFMLKDGKIDLPDDNTDFNNL